MAIKLLNTLESREVKKARKEGLQNVVIDFKDVVLNISTTITNNIASCEVVEIKPVTWVNPYEVEYDVKLTQAEAKEYKEKGEVIITRATGTYILKGGICKPLLDYSQAFVR